MPLIRVFRELEVYKAAFIDKVDQALGETMETQAWLDHAVDCEYLDEQPHAEVDEHMQHIGAMLNRMIERADDFCRQSHAPSQSSILNPRSSKQAS